MSSYYGRFFKRLLLAIKDGGATRGLPVLDVTGEVDPAVLSPGEAVHSPLPFSVDLSPAV